MMKKSTGELLEIMKSKRSYDEFLAEKSGELIDTTLSKYLEELAEKKRLKKSEIINKGNLDKNYAYQIFNGTKTNPSRNKVIMLAFGMELNLKETSELLRIANKSDLYVRDARDSVIIFGINKKMTLIQVNELLLDHGLAILE